MHYELFCHDGVSFSQLCVIRILPRALSNQTTVRCSNFEHEVYNFQNPLSFRKKTLCVFDILTTKVSHIRHSAFFNFSNIWHHSNPLCVLRILTTKNEPNNPLCVHPFWHDNFTLSPLCVIRLLTTKGFNPIHCAFFLILEIKMNLITHCALI